jgi:hypothetical protein
MMSSQLSATVRYAKRLRDFCSGRAGTVCNGHNFHTFLGLQARNMECHGVSSGADHADADDVIAHESVSAVDMQHTGVVLATQYTIFDTYTGGVQL